MRRIGPGAPHRSPGPHPRLRRHPRLPCLPRSPPAPIRSSSPRASTISATGPTSTNQFEEAASHFENAFFAAPNPAELRSAIRARRDAGELARAATLAAIGQRRFPGDAATAKVAADVIAQARPHVYEVKIASSALYSVAIDEKIVAAERVTESRLFVNPGSHQVVVSWSDDRNTRISIDATEGGTVSLQLDPPASPPPQPAPAPALAPGPAPVPAVVTPPPVAPPPPPSKPFGPTVFITGAALTAFGVGLIVWSGIDTLHSPGSSAVKTACAAGFNGNSLCQSDYREGMNAQLRTNIVVAATSAVAAATAIVGLFFTEWPSAPTAGVRDPTAGPRVAPVVGVGRAGVEGTF